jgi:hypothetical protein
VGHNGLLDSQRLDFFSDLDISLERTSFVEVEGFASPSLPDKPNFKTMHHAGL